MVLVDDGLFRGTRTIRLLAAAVTPGMAITGPSQMDIIIEDDDVPMVVPGRISLMLDGGGISGSVDATISATGAVTGKVITARGALAFKGTLVNGRLTVRLGSATSPLRTLTIELANPATKAYKLTLTDGVLGSVSSGESRATNFTKLTPCPAAGIYSFVDLGAAGIPQLVAASIKVDALGNAALSGKLFDGTVVVGTGAVDANSIAWTGAALYAGKGKAAVVAQVGTTPQTISNVALFTLLRPGRANQSVELPSLDVTASAIVARYTPPATGQHALQQWDPLGAASADISGGGFGSITRALSVSPANKVTVGLPNIEALKLTLTPATGFFSGSILPPGALKPSPIYGVMVQGGPANGGGMGFFLNGPTPGRIVLKNP